VLVVLVVVIGSGVVGPVSGVVGVTPEGLIVGNMRNIRVIRSLCPSGSGIWKILTSCRVRPQERGTETANGIPTRTPQQRAEETQIVAA
jgi:hypothetical protein